MDPFIAGSFTASTPFNQQHDSGFYENSPLSRNSSQISPVDNLESNYLPLRKTLFGKKRNMSENIPDDLFSNRHKLILSRSSVFSSRDANSNKETPRTRNSRSWAGSNKPVNFAEAITPKQPPQLFLNCNAGPLKQLDDNDSGLCGETQERLGSPESECSGVPLLQLIENFLKKDNSKKESLAYFKHSLNVSGAKNYAELSTAEIQRLYRIYRFQRMGLKPTIAKIDVCEKNLLINDKSETFLLSWKEKLECISADLEKEPKIDFLNYFHQMNALLIVSYILSNLSGRDLQNASCVNQLWRKLVHEDKDANRTRWAYLKERQKFKKEIEKKKIPPNLRILESNGNVQKEKRHLTKTIKEMNFDAFIEVGKSEKYKPMKCPSCGLLSLQNKQVITKCHCLFCGYEFCCNCLKPYLNWHTCASTYLSSNISIPKPCANGKRYLRRL